MSPATAEILDRVFGLERARNKSEGYHDVVAQYRHFSVVKPSAMELGIRMVSLVGLGRSRANEGKLVGCRRRAETNSEGKGKRVLKYESTSAPNPVQGGGSDRSAPDRRGREGLPGATEPQHTYF